ncbi:MAG: glycosyltransferase family 39 protein, partial [Flavobacteriales bacterium]
MNKIPPIRSLGNTYLVALVIILVVACFLRFFGWYTMPYQHDELSAISRLSFSSWGDLFQQGIMKDGHPALVQCFLYMWTGLFGTAEWIVKLPFVLCGIGSVYLTWRLAYKWNSATTALYSAAFMAVLQLPVFHSLHARPYAPGMLLLLWFALEWSKWHTENKPTKSMYARYVIAALLCAWCHHFTALGAVLLGLVGVFTVEKKKLKSYLLANVLVVLCYLPYLPVTLAQLKYGGLGGDNGWLKAPENTFIVDYLRHVFMYSPLMLVVLLVTLIFSFYKNPREVSSNIKWRAVALVMFLFPLLIGLFYSWYVSPVIQYSL